MMDSTRVPTPSSAEELTAEIERLRRERDELAQQLAGEGEVPAVVHQHRGRRIVTPVLVVLTVVCLLVAVPGTWVRRTFTNTDRYVSTVAPLHTDPAVVSYLSTQITDRVFAALGVDDRIGGVLEERAPRLVFLAGPIANAVEGYVHEQVQNLVASDLFQRLWTDATTRLHATVITVLNGDSQVLQVSNGNAVLNLLPIVNAALTRVSGFASDIVGRPITIPEITSGELPSSAIAKIESATGVTLPADFGQIEVTSADDLTSIQAAYALFDRGVILAAVGFLLFLLLAILVSTRRRRTLIQITMASAIVLVLERRLAIAGGNRLIDGAGEEIRGVVGATVDVFRASLLDYTASLLAVALVVLVITLITGPYPWAVRLRRMVAGLGASLVGGVQHRQTGSATAWVAAHRDPLLLGGAVVGLALLWWLDLSIAGFLVLALLLAAYGLSVWRLAAFVPRPEAVGRGSGSSPPSKA